MRPPKHAVDQLKFSKEIEAKLAKFPAIKQKNRRIMLARYERGQTAQGEERLLEKEGLIAAAEAVEKLESDNDTCDTHEELARRMMLHYQNPDKSSKLKISITKQTISDWSKSKRLNGKPMPPKPLEGVRRRWSLRAWIAWFDENFWHEYRADAHQVNGSEASKMSLGEIEEMAKRAAHRKTILETEDLEREIDETWTKKAVATASTIKAILMHHSFTKLALKDLTTHLTIANYTNEQIEEIKAAGSKVLEAIEKECEAAG